MKNAAVFCVNVFVIFFLHACIIAHNYKQVNTQQITLTFVLAKFIVAARRHRKNLMGDASDHRAINMLHCYLAAQLSDRKWGSCSDTLHREECKEEADRACVWRQNTLVELLALERGEGRDIR